MTTNAELANLLTQFVEKNNRYMDQSIALDTGIASYVPPSVDQPGYIAGWPGQPGYYPITGFDGVTRWKPCMERVRADAMAPIMLDLTGANSYTLNAGLHAGRFLNLYNNGGETVTLNSPLNLGKGFSCIVAWAGTQTRVNLNASAGVTILQEQGLNTNGRQIRMRARGSITSIVSLANNLITVSGGLLEVG